MSTEKYPEHAKFRIIQSDHVVIRRFIEWLQYEKSYEICRREKHRTFVERFPTKQTTEEILAEYFEIDLKKLEEEKVVMLSETYDDRE